jgi:hypothetical protein
MAYWNGMGRPALRQRTLDWPSYLGLCAAGLVLALTWLGPRPSAALGTLNAMAFWTAHVVPALAILGGAQLVVGRINVLRTLPGLAQVLLGGLLGALVFTPLALAIDAVFGTPISAEDATEALMLRIVEEFAQLAVPVVLVWSLINAPSLVRLEAPARRSTRPGAQAEAGTRIAADPAEDFWARVPRRLGRSLVAMSAELHYLRVHTTEGDALILFPFGRAVEMLDASGGMQVHRSHWVRLGAVHDIGTADGRMVLRLPGDLEVPVSRRYRASVRAALASATGA